MIEFIDNARETILSALYVVEDFVTDLFDTIESAIYEVTQDTE